MIKNGAILALDLGTSCGWAYAFGEANKAHASGCWNLAPRRFEGGGMRFVRFVNKLEELNDSYKIVQVVFEEVRRHMGVDAAHCYGGLMGHLGSWCEGKKIPYSGVSVQAIKKFATGKGNADKQAMIIAAEDAGYHPVNDDEADAIHLLRLTVAEGVA